MDHNVTIGAKVKAFRTAKKYTLKQLSEESGLSIGFLSQLERGLSSIAIDSLAKLAAILGVSLSSFFDSSAGQPEFCHALFPDQPPDRTVPGQWKCTGIRLSSAYLPPDAVRHHKL